MALACTGQSDIKPIEQVRETTKSASPEASKVSAEPKVSDAQRFGFQEAATPEADATHAHDAMQAPPLDPTSTTLPPSHPPISQMMPAAGPQEAPFAWTAPADWQADTPPSAMRLVSFHMGAENKTECYIIVLPGLAGGAEANINRWRGQMGQPVLDKDAFSKLEQLTVLGKPSPMVDVEGSFTGMTGGKQEGMRMLALVCELEGQSIFVKMTGPKDDVAARGEAFRAFCQSLALKQ
jgi:hypothetical protein